MASINKVILIGNLGRDPEVRYLPSGDAVANLALATTEQWKDKAGEKQEQTEWHRVAFFGRQAEICAEYLKKGSQIYVEGRLQTRKYTDKEGVERYSTEVRGDRMQMLGGRGGAGGGGSMGAEPPSRDHDMPSGSERGAPVERQQPPARPKGGGGFDDLDDDIPF